MEEQIENAFADPLIGPLLSVFWESFTQKVTLLKESFATHDTKKIQQLLHNLKGSAAMYGFDDLSARCAAMEANQNREPAQVQEFLAFLEHFGQQLEHRLV